MCISRQDPFACRGLGNATQIPHIPVNLSGFEEMKARHGVLDDHMTAPVTINLYKECVEVWQKYDGMQMPWSIGVNGDCNVVSGN